MAGVKRCYYVLVFTNDGPLYVTDTLPKHFAEWEKTKAPKKFSREWADDITTGLLWNGYSAVTIESRIEIEKQPYNYEKYILKFEEKENA